MRKILITSIFFIFILKTQAQQELMLHSLPNLWHANALNPAFFPHEKRIAIGLPGIGIDAAHSNNVAYNDLFVKNGNTTKLDFGALIANLEDQNDIFYEHRIETISLGLKLPKGFHVMGGHATRMSASMTYPKDLPELLWKGNGDSSLIGKVLDIAPTAQIALWNEWSLGLSKKIGIVTVGAKLKYLTGLAAIKTDSDHRKTSFYTNPDIYQLELETDYGFHSSEIVSALDTAGYGFDLKLAELPQKLFSKNKGIAFDLGVHVKFSDRVTVSASALDLGSMIKWTEQANYFKSQGKYTYNGVNIPSTTLINGGDSLSFDQKLDTLNDIFKFQKTAESFETQLPTRFYLGGRFMLTQKWVFSANLFHQRSDDSQTTAFGVGAQFMPLKWLSVGAMYSINDRDVANVGFHVSAKPGPVQLYLTSDNLLNAFTFKSGNAANVRLGAALVF